MYTYTKAVQKKEKNPVGKKNRMIPRMRDFAAILVHKVITSTRLTRTQITNTYVT